MADLAEITLSIQLPILIRQVKKHDLPNLEWNGQFTHYRNLFRRNFREQEEGKRILLIADSNGIPIARLFILFKSQDTDIADGKVRGYLYSFYVMEAFRKHGIGTRLIQAAENILRERNFKIATIAVSKTNIDALRLYQHLGYEEFGESSGKWQYRDHRGRLKKVNDPCWLLEKNLTTN